MRIVGRSILLLAFACSLVLATSQASAQQTRIAYIDASKLLKRMPEARDAQNRLDQLTESWKKEAGEMESEISRKQADFERRKLIMTDAERTAADLDIQNLKKKRDDYLHQKFDPQTGGELFSQQAQLMKAAYEKLTNAIREAAEDGKYDYVIDRSSKDVVLLYTNTKFDLTIPVARKLGIESEILTTPLVQGTNKPAPQPGVNPQQPGQPPPQSMQPNPGTNPLTPQQQPPPFNSGGINPNQNPPPPQKQPAVSH